MKKIKEASLKSSIKKIKLGGIFIFFLSKLRRLNPGFPKRWGFWVTLVTLTCATPLYVIPTGPKSSKSSNPGVQTPPGAAQSGSGLAPGSF